MTVEQVKNAFGTMKFADYLKIGSIAVMLIIASVGVQYQVDDLSDDVGELKQDFGKFEDETNQEQRYVRGRLAAHDTSDSVLGSDLKHIAESLDDLTGLIKEFLMTVPRQDRG